MRELSEITEKDDARSVVIFLVQRNDVVAFKIAKDIDPEYWNSVIAAKHKGVEFIAYTCNVTAQGIYCANSIPLII